MTETNDMVEKPTVLLHWDASGGFHWHATDGVQVVCVDERAPGDRVYVTEGAGDMAVIAALANGDFADPIDAANAIWGRTE